MQNVISGHLSLDAMFTVVSRNASANSDAEDISNVQGDPLVLLDAEAGTGTTPTLALTIQHRVNSDDSWANVPSTALYDPDTGDDDTFDQVTDAAASTQVKALRREQLKAEIRAVLTLGGTTPAFVCGVYLASTPKYGSNW
jgi:hypothetical protein